ncbi:MAG: hypothetical protein DMF84_09410 [Acidobacteria bacterium]|nr:MAG: hypothetical protein DMF84_09410 [Acidobacteriota bacterium]
MLAALAAAASVIQLALGAPIVVVLLAILAVSASLLGFVALGPYNTGSWVSLFYGLGNALVALYAKTVLGQPLDSHLEAAAYSFAAIAVTSTALVAALALARWIRVGRPLFSAESDPSFLGFLSWTCFVLGTLFWIMNGWFQDPSGTGFGGVALFRDLLLMAVIARTAMLLERSGFRQTFDLWLGSMFVVSVCLGLIDNTKTSAALPIVSYIATVFFYRRGLPLATIAAAIVGWIAFAIVIGPLIHGLRALGQRDLSVNERVELITSTTARLIHERGEFEDLRAIGDGQFGEGYYNYFGGNGAGQMLLGRYASVQQIDPVIAAVNRRGPQGGEALWPAVTRLMPSFINPDKPQYIPAYTTVVYYGLVDPAGGKYPSLPLAGQAFAGYGIQGLLTVPFLTFLAFFLVAKKWGWQLYRNVYAIFFFCDFVIVYTSQGDFGHYSGAVLRNFPLFTMTFWSIAKCFRVQRGSLRASQRRLTTDPAR